MFKRFEFTIYRASVLAKDKLKFELKALENLIYKLLSKRE